MKTLMNCFVKNMNMLMIGLCLLMFAPLAFAQAAGDIDIGTFINQVVADAQTINGISGSALYLAIAAVLIRALTSLVKVSFLRNLIKWDSWSNSLKMLWAPALGVLVIAVEVRPFTLAAVGVGLFTGIGAIAMHSLLDTVEGLPGINATVLFVIKLFSTILGGNTPQLLAHEAEKKALKLAKKSA